MRRKSAEYNHDTDIGRRCQLFCLTGNQREGQEKVAIIIWINIRRYIYKKVQARRLHWYERVTRRNYDYAGKEWRGIGRGRRRKGRQKRRWMDSVDVDLREKGVSGEKAKNR